jgi:hypothetical protein
MHCKSCGSEHQGTFNGEMAIHFQGLENIDKPIVWIFPEIAVCFKCGFAGLTIAEADLRRLDEPTGAPPVSSFIGSERRNVRRRSA